MLSISLSLCAHRRGGRGFAAGTMAIASASTLLDLSSPLRPSCNPSSSASCSTLSFSSSFTGLSISRRPPRLYCSTKKPSSCRGFQNSCRIVAVSEGLTDQCMYAEEQTVLQDLQEEQAAIIPKAVLPLKSDRKGYVRFAFWTGSSDGDKSPEFSVRSAECTEDGASEHHSKSSNDSWLSRLLKVDWPRLLFGLSKDEVIWKVPWTLQTVLQVMFLWFFAFWLVGSWIIPLVAHTIGFSKDSLTYRGQALYSLITDVAEGTIGLGILYQCLRQFLPLSKEWFPLNWHGKWYMEACCGCLMFPFVNRLSQINLELLPFPSPLTSNVEQSIIARDPVATLLYAVVVSVCAPIWEEVIFRGFLLPSLTRYVPIWASIVFSAFAFSLAHFSIQRILPLTALGLVMGIVFVRSRNLLASMLLHSLWNSFVFLDLLR